MSANIPKAGKNLNDAKQRYRLKPLIPISRLANQLTGGILNTAFLELIEMRYVAKCQIILKNPQGYCTVFIQIMPHEGTHMLLV